MLTSSLIFPLVGQEAPQTAEGPLEPRLALRRLFLDLLQTLLLFFVYLLLLGRELGQRV